MKTFVETPRHTEKIFMGDKTHVIIDEAKKSSIMVLSSQINLETNKFDKIPAKVDILENDNVVFRGSFDYLCEVLKKNGKAPNPQELADFCSNFINVFCYEEKAEQFVNAMGRKHRTLQQSFTEMCFMWIRYLANQDNYDARNESAIKVSKEIVDKVLELKGRLPMI